MRYVAIPTDLVRALQAGGPDANGQVPERKLSLTVRAAFDGQELVTDRSTGVTYWEGAVVVEGTRDRAPISGRGYLEMTGYSGQAMGRLLE